MRPSQLMQTSRRRVFCKGLFAAWSIVICVGSLGMVTQSQAQQLLPADRVEVADQERLGWTLQKLPPQPFMNEIYWQVPNDTPAFFRDSPRAIRGPDILLKP